MRPEDALLFTKAFNSQTPKPLPEGGKAVLAPPSQQELSYLQLARAVRLGASRTLGIFGIDWKQVNREQIQADFSRYGHIVDISIVKADNCAFISYSDLITAMRTVDHVHLNNRNFRRYAGTKITFVQDKTSTIPRVIPLSIKADRGVEADPALVADAAPSQTAKAQTSEVPSEIKVTEA
ncbi:hypothetical protein L218DRAFT_850328 [Marasmius fiardii PR-910]|nr:hypothetical protein L218DRAFT_850328 [Marasmius fiardii PR-910]